MFSSQGREEALKLWPTNIIQTETVLHESCLQKLLLLLLLLLPPPPPPPVIIIIITIIITIIIMTMLYMFVIANSEYILIKVGFCHMTN